MKFNYLLRETQFHGGRRLAEKHFRWWSLGLFLLFGAAAAVVCATIQRFQLNPTYLIQEEKMDESQLFPSVLVCPEVVFLDWKINAFFINMKIPSHLNIAYLKKIIHQLAAFFSPDVAYRLQDLENLEYLLDYNNISLDTAGQLLTSTCQETLIRCRWRGKFVNCSKLFYMELTGDGYCCVFNGQSLKRKHQNLKNKTIYVTRFAGFSNSLMLAVNQSQEPFNVDLSYKWLALQGSQHFVESSINGTPLNPGSEQWATYHIRNFKIAEDARILSDDLKKCRMRSVPLEYYTIYNRRYCLIECEMHRTLSRCNCIRNIHPRPEGAAYCRAQDLTCTLRAKVSYASKECNCPTACDVAADHVKTSNFQLFSNVNSLDSFYEGLDFNKVTIVRIFLQNRQVKTSIRCSYFNKLDLFAQLGGVFNLFFGCSILTMLELVMLGVHWFKLLKHRNKIKPNENTSSEVKLIKKNRKRKKNQRVKFIESIS